MKTLIAISPCKGRSLVIVKLAILLTVLGYDPGPEDGIMGSLTQSAIQAFLRDRDGLISSNPTLDDLIKEMQSTLKVIENDLRKLPEIKPNVGAIQIPNQNYG